MIAAHLVFNLEAEWPTERVRRTGRISEEQQDVC